MALNPIASSSAPIDTSATRPALAPPVVATVGGKTYVANVSYSAGEYVAEDPTTYGAVATGADPQAADEAFQNRIDFLA